MNLIKQLASVALALALAPAVQVVAAAELSLGDPAPAADVKMKNVDNTEISIAEVAGEAGTLVIFTCNHCPYAKAWESRIAEIGNVYRAKKVGVIAINSNDPAAYPEDGFEVMQERARKQGMKFPYVVDATSNVARAFGATRTPEAFLFDGEGKLVYHGTIDDNYKDAGQVTKPYLRDALDALLDGKEIPLAETKALGCGIKFRS
jgi:thiol-disulfide isomerase/thioredoxin